MRRLVNQSARSCLPATGTHHCSQGSQDCDCMWQEISEHLTLSFSWYAGGKIQALQSFLKLSALDLKNGEKGQHENLKETKLRSWLQVRSTSYRLKASPILFSFLSMPDLFNETLLGEFYFIINKWKGNMLLCIQKRNNTAAALCKPSPFLRLGKVFTASAYIQSYFSALLNLGGRGRMSVFNDWGFLHSY